jgi:hypothetical protein
MLHWDKRMRAARIRPRLEKASVRAVVSFAAGAIEHAYREVRKNAAWTGSVPEARRHIEEALRTGWALVDGGAAPEDAKAMVRAMSEHAPDEDRPGIAGEDDLLSGSMQLLKMLANPQSRSATSVASYAYQAIMAVELPTVSGGEAAVEAAERSCAPCQNEIAFQLDYLSALERLGSHRVDFASVLREMKTRYSC